MYQLLPANVYSANETHFSSSSCLQVLGEVSLNCAIGLLQSSGISIERQFTTLPLFLHPAVAHAAFPSIHTDGKLQVRCHELSCSALTCALHCGALYQNLSHFSVATGVFPDEQGFSSTVMSPQVQQVYQTKYGILKSAIQVQHAC